MITIDLYDEDNVYGRIETEEDPYKIKNLLKVYKSLNEEEYNLDDFYEFLKSKDVDFTTINIEADMRLYF